MLRSLQDLQIEGNCRERSIFPKSLTSLKLGKNFNSSVSVLPRNLITLKFGVSFNQEISFFFRTEPSLNSNSRDLCDVKTVKYNTKNWFGGSGPTKIGSQHGTGGLISAHATITGELYGQPPK